MRFGNTLDDPRVYQQLDLYLQTLPKITRSSIIKNLRKTNKSLTNIPIDKAVLNITIDDFTKMEMYINFVDEPEWEVIMPRLKMFRNSILLKDYDQIHWHKPQWAMVIAFHQYSYYQGKGTFNAFEKGLNICYYNPSISEFRAIANYEILMRRTDLKLIDFYNYIKKYFTLNTLKCIGY